jgi:hypothetical protein
MKFNYDCIKENLRIYNEAKSIFPIIEQYEKDEVSYSSMRSLKLESFADFYNFLKFEKSKGFEIIQAVSFKELKQIISDNTRSERFKKFFENIKLNTFEKLLTEDAEKFDRYLNGRWKTKPGYTRIGNRTYGRRSNEKAEGLNIAFVPLMNWIISNDIDITDTKPVQFGISTWQTFNNQDVYSIKMKWFVGVLLSLENIPKREIDITSKLLNSLVDFIQDSDIDFRKLNSDFIVETLSNKIKNLMTIPQGTTLVSLVDKDNDYGRQILTKNKNYVVESSSINCGFIRVMVKDDLNYNNYFDYKLFEDISLQRDMLLSQLGII